MEERVLTPTMEELMAKRVAAEQNRRLVETERDRLKAAYERLEQRVQNVSALCMAAEQNGEDYLTVSAVFAALLEGTP
jgi:hypothetical protein